MKKDFLAHFTIQNGQIVWKNQAYMDVGLPKYEGLSGVLQIKVKKSTRSLSQNALYWVWLTTIAEYCGNSAEEMHTIMKGLFGFKKEVKVKTKNYMIPRSTTTYSKGEMVEYMFMVEQEAAKLGIVLPHPEDLSTPKLRNEK